MTNLLFNINSKRTLSLIFINILLILILNTLFNYKPKKNNFPTNVNKPKPKPKCNKSVTNLNTSPEWTDDHIIPLKSYNQCDCTNDNSCIISPDSNNIFPGFNPKTL